MAGPVIFEMLDGDTLDEAPVALNYEYRDLRGTAWIQVEEAIAHDRVLIPLLERQGDARDAFDDYVKHEMEGDVDPAALDRFELYTTLDPEVASAVLALAAAGAAPVSSCNGGIFGDDNQENFPLSASSLRTHSDHRLPRPPLRVGSISSRTR